MADCAKMAEDSRDNNEYFERFSVEKFINNNLNYLETMALLINDDTDMSLLDGNGSDSSEPETEFFCLMIMGPNVWKYKYTVIYVIQNYTIKLFNTP